MNFPFFKKNKNQENDSSVRPIKIGYNYNLGKPPTFESPTQSTPTSLDTSSLNNQNDTSALRQQVDEKSEENIESTKEKMLLKSLVNPRIALGEYHIFRKDEFDKTHIEAKYVDAMNSDNFTDFKFALFELKLGKNSFSNLEIMRPSDYGDFPLNFAEDFSHYGHTLITSTRYTHLPLKNIRVNLQIMENVCKQIVFGEDWQSENNNKEKKMFSECYKTACVMVFKYCSEDFLCNIMRNAYERFEDIKTDYIADNDSKSKIDKLYEKMVGLIISSVNVPETELNKLGNEIKKCIGVFIDIKLNMIAEKKYLRDYTTEMIDEKINWFYPHKQGQQASKNIKKIPNFGEIE